MKIKFKGTSDSNFTKNKIYTLVNLGTYQDIHTFIMAYIVNNDNEIVLIPYDNMNLFNDNWEM